MKEITSVQNEHIKIVTKLHSSKGRKEHQQFLAEGVRVLESFSQAGWVPVELFVTQALLKTAQKLFREEPVLVSEPVMKKISTATTPSGIVAVFSYPAMTTSLSAGLVLVDITDPGNMGTLIRSAAAFGSHSLVIVGGCDPYAPKVVQASAGALASIHLFQWTWRQLLEYKKDLSLCALVVKNGLHPKNITEKNLLLVVGNEAHGLSEEHIRDCEYTMTLPMQENTESLNVAVAGSLALYLSTH